MKSKMRVSFMVIFTMMLFFTTMTARGAEESQTIRITFDDDDGFITETGAHFPGGSLVAILDPNMDIHSWLVFRVIDINSFESLTNATLRLRTASSLPFDADSTITIYGVKDGEFPGFSSPSAVPSYPLTFAHVDYNTSEFYGSGWKEIDVSNIVEELKSSPSWEGDEATFPGTFGFIIEGAEGHDTRYFYDFGAGNGFEAQLVIHWGEIPEVDPGDQDPDYNGTEFVWEYVNTTIAYDPGDNETDPWEGEVDIFKVTEYGEPEVLVVTSHSLVYFNTTKGDPNYVNWAGSSFTFQSGGGSEFIAHLNGWTFLIGSNETDLEIFYSDDEFSTWKRDEVNLNFDGTIAGRGSDWGSIWPDQNGSDVIHLVWSSYSDWAPAGYTIMYANFTLDPVTENLTWTPDYFNVSAGSSGQTDADMYQQKDGTIHVTWTGQNGTANDMTQYRRRQANGTWLPSLRLYGLDDWDCFGSDVVANESSGVALIAWTRADTGPWDIYWDVVFPNNTQGVPVGTEDRRINNARYVTMVNDRDSNVAHLAYQDDNGIHIEYTYRGIDNSSAWAGAQQVSSLSDRHYNPSISVDELNDTLAIIWWNSDSSETDWSVFQIEDGPPGFDTLLLNFQLKYPSNPDFYSRGELSVTWWLVWPNGTVVGGPYDSEDDAASDLDDLFGVNPLDPNPPSKGWDETGPFTRFKTRMYIFIIGFIMMMGPFMVFANQGRPDGYTFVVGLFISLIGIALLISAGTV